MRAPNTTPSPIQSRSIRGSSRAEQTRQPARGLVVCVNPTHVRTACVGIRVPASPRVLGVCNPTNTEPSPRNACTCSSSRTPSASASVDRRPSLASLSPRHLDVPLSPSLFLPLRGTTVSVPPSSFAREEGAADAGNAKREKYRRTSRHRALVASYNEYHEPDT